MKIYTKGGDKGQTQIYAEQMIRVSKDDNILECYGVLDELNAHIGLLNTQLQQYQHTSHTGTLRSIQNSLFQIGFAISASSKLQQSDIDELEFAIDTVEEKLPAQTSFVLPGGHLAACQAHVCRTVCRRAERNLVRLANGYTVPPLCLAYINRLSDYLFVVARDINHHFDHDEQALNSL